MTVLVVTPPEPIVSLAEAKAHLRVDDTADDALIEAFIAAATEHLDGPGGWLGRALGEQTLEARFDHFGCQPIPLPYPPVIDIVSVGYVDDDGEAQTVASDAYTLSSHGLSPAYGTTWPAIRYQDDAVSIRYTAGWPMDDDVWTGPAPIKAAILLMVGDLYENREAQVITSGSAVLIDNRTAQSLLAPWRVWSV